MFPIHLRLLLFAVGGIFGEILFTSLKALVLHRDITLHGKTQLWVVALYGFGGLWFECMERVLRRFHFGVRYTGYVLAVWSIEYAAGYVLDQWLIGECPWRYSGWTNLHGYIQLSHLPWWVLLSFVAERLLVYMRTHSLVKDTQHVDGLVV